MMVSKDEYGIERRGTVVMLSARIWLFLCKWHVNNGWYMTTAG